MLIRTRSNLGGDVGDAPRVKAGYPQGGTSHRGGGTILLRKGRVIQNHPREGERCFNLKGGRIGWAGGGG